MINNEFGDVSVTECKFRESTQKRTKRRTRHWYCCISPAKEKAPENFLFIRMYNVGKTPMLITCPSCRSTENTHVDLIITRETHIAALFFLPLLLCWLPYITVMFRKARHHCGACGAYIGETR